MPRESPNKWLRVESGNNAFAESFSHWSYHRDKSVLDILQYYGAGAATLAALIVALNLGRLWNGGAMIIFITSSAALITWGFLQPNSEGIGWQNVALLLINSVGAYRYLIHDAHKRKKRDDNDATGRHRPKNSAVQSRA